jgi:alcohol dehydrogenase class IV
MTRRFEMTRVETVLEGDGAASNLGEELDARGLSRALVVSGRSVSATAGFGSFLEALGDRTVGVFKGIQAHNPNSVLADLLALSREVEPDVFISVGGGSCSDAAKFAALAASEGLTAPEELIPYAVQFEYPDREYVKPLGAAPGVIVNIPTTLSAAEWDGFAGTVEPDTHVKHVLRYLELTPSIVVLDPVLCEPTPRQLWATTGVRSIDHAIETSYALNAHPSTTALALGALEMLARNLPRSVADPTDHDSALECLIAGGMSILGVHNVSLGLSHAIGHQLGGYGVPHGVTSCIMLPHVMRFLAPATEREQEAIRRILSQASGEAPESGSPADHVERLYARLGVPRNLADFGLTDEDLDAVAAATMEDIA